MGIYLINKNKNHSSIKLHYKKIYLIIALYYVAILIVALLPSDFLVMYIFPDDAYYYFEIAKNLARKGIVSFDTINPTNGFQPLWLLLLTPLYSLGMDNITSLRFLILYQGVINMFTIYFVYKVISILFSKRTAFFSGIFYAFTPFIFQINIQGCEASLNGFILIICIYYLITQNFKKINYKKVITIGFLLSMLFIIRIDNIIFIISILFWLIFTGEFELKIKNLKYIVSFLMVLSIFPVIYLSWNYLNFGHLMPISGYIFGSTIEAVLLYLVIVVIVIFFLSYYFKKKPHLWEALGNRRNLIAIIFAPILHIFYYVFVGGRIGPWYLALELLVLTIIVSFMVEIIYKKLDKTNLIKTRFRENLSIVCLFSLIILFYCIGLNQVVKVFDLDYFHHSYSYYEACQWANNNTPEDAIFASGNAGFFGYFIDRPLIETWGLVNSYEFYQTYKGIKNFIMNGTYDYYIEAARFFHLSEQEVLDAGLVLIMQFNNTGDSRWNVLIWYHSS